MSADTCGPPWTPPLDFTQGWSWGSGHGLPDLRWALVQSTWHWPQPLGSGEKARKKEIPFLKGTTLHFEFISWANQCRVQPPQLDPVWPTSDLACEVLPNCCSTQITQLSCDAFLRPRGNVANTGNVWTEEIELIKKYKSRKCGNSRQREARLFWWPLWRAWWYRRTWVPSDSCLWLSNPQTLCSEALAHDVSSLDLPKHVFLFLPFSFAYPFLIPRVPDHPMSAHSNIQVCPFHLSSNTTSPWNIYGLIAGNDVSLWGTPCFWLPNVPSPRFYVIVLAFHISSKTGGGVLGGGIVFYSSLCLQLGQALCLALMPAFSLFKKIFIWLYWVLVAACGI